MGKKMIKKGLVVGILVLFIGTSVLPTINGNIVKTINKSTIQDPTILHLSSNYVNAYWKFDEGQGNIAHDSSGHNYDGTIYGATWTTGKYGYALDFDGIDDYIKLDSYAKNYLGFNKTDDLMYEFYFQSTNPGIIYSICYSGGYNPGFHIALNPNGSLQVRMWRLSCGILFNSKYSYNNDSWQKVKVVYNGITSNPTVEIYVNDTLDSSTTEWVCDFYADLFDYAKIGRQANESTNFFDGKIDEFKITKYPGGNEQNPPIISGPTKGDPGVTYDYTFVTNDPEEDDIWFRIDWGDGEITDWLGPYKSGQAVVKSHKWDEQGKYRIKAQSKDVWHFSRWSDQYIVRIGNQAPEMLLIGGPQCGETGNQYTYTFVAEDFENNSVYYYVDWGDGTHIDWFGPYQSGEEANAAHIWDSDGYYNMKAKAQDTFGNEGEWSEPYPVRIGDKPPGTPTITGPSQGTINIPYDFRFVSIDPEGDNVYYEIQWGDGKTTITDFNNSNELINVGHTYTKKGTFIIQAKACDVCGKWSQWGSYEIKIPKSKILINPLFLKLVEKLPLLQKIIHRLKL